MSTKKNSFAESFRSFKEQKQFQQFRFFQILFIFISFSGSKANASQEKGSGLGGKSKSKNALNPDKLPDAGGNAGGGGADVSPAKVNPKKSAISPKPSATSNPKPQKQTRAGGGPEMDEQPKKMNEDPPKAPSNASTPGTGNAGGGGGTPAAATGSKVIPGQDGMDEDGVSLSFSLSSESELSKAGYWR